MIPFATPTAQEVLERRRLRGELSAPPLDSLNLRLYPLPSQVVQREAFAADRYSVPDSYQGERVPFAETPTWHFHGKRQ